jgi:hypothetical protein
MSAFSFRGRVSDAGKMYIDADNQEPMRSALLDLAGERVTFTVEHWRETRSNQQNRWYRGVIVPAVARELSKGRALPLSNDAAHYVLKSAFIGVEDTPLGPAPKSTKTLNTQQFSEYCERIRAHFAAEYGLNIPDPVEVNA